MISRRQFLKASSALAAINLLPSHAWANSPNGKVCVAFIGLGAMGGGDLKRISSHPKVQVVGLCDVDSAHLQKAAAKHPDAATFVDYRKMLADLGDKVDAVVVATPDHTHAPASMEAMSRKKHIYCEKPLTHGIAEAYKMNAMAQKYDLTTQMGIQMHSRIGYRMAVEAIRSGLIGKISKTYAWSHKSWGYDGAPYQGSDPVPDSLNWDLWLGPASARPYLKGKYHPGQWRKLLDFGCGTLGDMGVHMIDTPLTAMDLGMVKSVKATCREPNRFSHPSKYMCEYKFEGSAYTTDEVTFTWFDGNFAPSVAKTDNPDLQLPAGRSLPKQGAMFIGEGGNRILLPHAGGPQFLPRSLVRNFEKPKLEAIDHYHVWVDAILGKAKTNAGFDYAHKLTTDVLLGVVASRFPGKTLEWSGEKMRFTNHDQANLFVARDYETGY